MMLGNGSGTHFGAQCFPMRPCHLTRRLTLGVVIPLHFVNMIMYENPIDNCSVMHLMKIMTHIKVCDLLA